MHTQLLQTVLEPRYLQLVAGDEFSVSIHHIYHVPDRAAAARTGVQLIELLIQKALQLAHPFLKEVHRLSDSFLQGCRARVQGHRCKQLLLWFFGRVVPYCPPFHQPLFSTAQLFKINLRLRCRMLSLGHEFLEPSNFARHDKHILLLHNVGLVLVNSFDGCTRVLAFC